MKKLFSKARAAVMAVFAAIASVVEKAIINAFPAPSGKGMFLKQGGFVLLGKAYAGYAQGTIVELPASTEAALIASGQATNSAGPATAGAVTTTANSGSVTAAAAAASVVVTNANVSVQSIIYAVVSQAAADGTALRVDRVSVAAGSFTIFLNAAATAATSIDWAILNPNGSLSNPQ